MDNFLNEINKFLMEENSDLLSTFEEWKSEIKNEEAGKQQQSIVNKHTNTAHNNVGAYNQSNTWQNPSAYKQYSQHSNSGGHGNSHNNSHVNDGSSYDCWWTHNNFGHNNWTSGWHGNHGNHSNGGTSHTNVAAVPHGNTHSNTAHNNVAAVNKGFNHTNYLPSQPSIYDIPTYLKGNVTLQIYSYDKDGSQVFYKVEVQKVGTSQWYTLKDNTSESCVWDTLNPLSPGMDMNGDFYIRVTPYNKVNNDTVVQNGTQLTKIVTLKQNTSPSINVNNGQNFINFVFGEKVYDNAETETYKDKFGQENFLVNVNIKDIDADNYLKGWVDILVNGSVALTKNIVWSDNGSTAIKTNVNNGRAGYALFTKDELRAISQNQSVTVRVRAQDYMDDSCTQACDAVVTTTQANGINMNFALDFATPSLEITGFTDENYNQGVTLNFAKSDVGKAGISHILVTKPNGQTFTTTDNSYKVTENGTWKFTLYDKAGNASATQSYKFTKIDISEPSLTVSGYQDSIYSQEVKLKFHKKDSGVSGIDYVLIQLPNGSSIKSYLDEYIVVENGTYTFTLYDHAGNASEPKSYTFTKIDRIKPVVTPVQINKEGWVAKAEVTFTTSDNLSGVSQVFVRKAGEVVKYPYAPNAKFTTKENGTYYISAVDSAGNMSEEVELIISNVDMVAPQVTVEYISPASNQYVDYVEVLVTGIDSESGIKSIHLPTGQVIFADSYVFRAVDNGTYTFYVTDNAGNKSEVNSISINNIDTTGVSVQVRKEYDEETQKVNINFTLTDNESGVSKLITPTQTIELNGQKVETVTDTVSENGTYTYQIVNGVGKVTNYRVTVNECPGAGIDSFQIISATNKDGTESMLATGSVLPSASAGVYKGAVITLKATTINSPDDVLFSLSGASSAYVLDSVSASRGGNDNEWLFTFEISDMSVSNAVIEIEAQAVTGNIYSESKTVTLNLTRDADGEPIANIIG